VIRSFRSKALEQLFQGNPKRIEASLRRKVENILLTLNAATEIQAMNLPGYRLRELRGEMAKTWAVTVRQNWRITSASKTAMRTMSISWTTIDRGIIGR
jgi:proteic killer suppression protein